MKTTESLPKIQFFMEYILLCCTQCSQLAGGRERKQKSLLFFLLITQPIIFHIIYVLL